MGVHLGDVFHDAGDVAGDGVNIAARLQPKARPGTICLSQSVYDAVKGKVPFTAESLGSQSFKNIAGPITVYLIAPAGAKVPGGVRQPDRRWWLAGAGLGAAVLLAVLFWPRPAPPAVAAVANRSIAVLPFVNMGADKADEYLGDGMTEELLNVLAKVKGLRVPGRSSSFAFKGKMEEGIFRRVGEQLHVSTVLEGSVRKVGDKLRITAQLINVANGFHLWSETYDRDMTDILAIQSDVAQRVVQALQVQLGVEAGRELSKKATANPEAHRRYLLGRFHFAKFTEAGWADAMQAFNQAIQLDPAYALPYCGLADNYSWMGGNLIPGKEAWTKQKEQAQKALALDPNLAEAHLSMGMALADAFDWQGFERETSRALELNPNLTLAHDQRAWASIMFGRFDEGIAEQKIAVELDPLSLLMHGDLAWLLYSARRFDEGATQARKTLELDPNYAIAHAVLGLCLLRKGNLAGAMAEFQKAKSLDPQPSFDSFLGYAFALAGERNKAEQVLRGLDELAKKRYVSPATRLWVYLGLGEKGKALDWLEKCLEEQDSSCWTLKIDPVFDDVRNEPRFQAVLRKIGLVK